MRKKLLILSLLAMGIFTVQAKDVKVSGPDGKLQVTITDQDGKPAYSVSYNQKKFIELSPLGMKTNVGDFSQEMVMKENTTSSIDENYELKTTKKSKIHYVANELTCSFVNKDKHKIDVIFRVSNNDVAFKYKLYPCGDNLSCVINEEATGFNIPEKATSFLCPQVLPMGGFARTYPSYETDYEADAPLSSKSKNGQGYTFPCLFRIGEDGWALLSETGVTSAYCGSHLKDHKDGSTTYTIAFPHAGECNGNGTSAPAISMPGETPWRTITVGETLAPIAETTVSLDVVKPLYEATKKYEYGRGTWSWIMWMDRSMNYDDQKQYIDFASTLGYEFILIDALWDKNIGYEKMEELVKYAASKGVGVFLWYNSNGYWNDAPQGPRGIMGNIIARKKEMKWLQKIGIKGLKIDFFGGDKQMMMQLYEDILSDANDYELGIIFHGCTLPRGWERMYPNFISSEAVLASENLNFSQERNDKEAFSACLHPFIRNAVASMEFGGSTLNRYYNRENSKDKRGNTRRTSDVFELATAVLFQSSVQNFALAPNNLIDAPAWAIEFMKKVPTTWDETKFIDGYPGKYVVLARRHANKWYVAAINAEKKTKVVNISLAGLNVGTKAILYNDNAKLEGNCSELNIDPKKPLKLTIPTNGGALIELDSL